MRAAVATGRSRAPSTPPAARGRPCPGGPSVGGAQRSLGAPKFPLGARRPHPPRLSPSPSSRAAGGRFQRFQPGEPKQKENEAADSEFVTAVLTYTAQAAAAAEAAEKTEEKAAPAAA